MRALISAYRDLVETDVSTAGVHPYTVTRGLWLLIRAGEVAKAKAEFRRYVQPSYGEASLGDCQGYINLALRLGETKLAEAKYAETHQLLAAEPAMQRRLLRVFARCWSDYGGYARAAVLLRSLPDAEDLAKEWIAQIAAELRATGNLDGAMAAVDRHGVSDRAVTVFSAAAERCGALGRTAEAARYRERAWEVARREFTEDRGSTVPSAFYTAAELARFPEHWLPSVSSVEEFGEGTPLEDKWYVLALMVHRHGCWPGVAELDGRLRISTDDNYSGGGVRLLQEAYLHTDRAGEADVLAEEQAAPLRTLLAYCRCLHLLRAGRSGEAVARFELAEKLNPHPLTHSEYQQSFAYDFETYRHRLACRVLLGWEESLLAEWRGLGEGDFRSALETAINVGVSLKSSCVHISAWD